MRINRQENRQTDMRTVEFDRQTQTWCHIRLMSRVDLYMDMRTLEKTGHIYTCDRVEPIRKTL